MGIPTVKWGKEIQHIFVLSLELNSCFFLCSCGKKSPKKINPSHQAQSLTGSWHALHCSAGHLRRGENFIFLIYFVLLFFRLSTINWRYTYDPDLWDIHPHQHYVAGCSCHIVSITITIKSIIAITTIIVTIIITNITAILMLQDVCALGQLVVTSLTSVHSAPPQICLKVKLLHLCLLSKILCKK